MRFMNEYDIESAVERFEGHPVLGPATRTLQNLQRWANENSDGWAYWPKPYRAAARLQELLEGDGSWFYREALPGSVTEKEYAAALRPIKAFRTRQGADFVIVEAGA